MHSCCVQAFEHLQSFVAECDRKMEQSKKRLKETQEELSEEAGAKVCLALHIFTAVHSNSIYAMLSTLYFLKL